MNDLRRCHGTLVAAALAGGLAASPASAEEEVTPRLDVAVSVEIEDDFTFKSEDEDAELNDLYTTIEPYFTLQMTPELSLQAGLVLEPVEDPQPGQDRAFEDIGLYVEQLYLAWEGERGSALAGKHNPVFGQASDMAPGIYGADLADDYELTERLGIAVGTVFGDEESGKHTLTLDGFLADRTALSSSLGTERSRLRRGDGGPSNTGNIESVSLSLVGEGLPVASGLGYNLGLLLQGEGRGDRRGERGAVAGVSLAQDLGEATSIEPFVELAFIANAEGVAQDRTYLTAGATLYHGDARLALAYGQRNTDVENDNGQTDQLFQASIGYALSEAIDLELGYRLAEEDDVTSHLVGFVLAVALDTSLP